MTVLFRWPVLGRVLFRQQVLRNLWIRGTSLSIWLDALTTWISTSMDARLNNAWNLVTADTSNFFRYARIWNFGSNRTWQDRVPDHIFSVSKFLKLSFCRFGWTKPSEEIKQDSNSDHGRLSYTVMGFYSYYGYRCVEISWIISFIRQPVFRVSLDLFERVGFWISEIFFVSF
ncbi:unnamed protein product [Rhizophagus irregularis]|nr:unnamed protein product [Rhizophagus irregularis]